MRRARQTVISLALLALLPATASLAQTVLKLETSAPVDRVIASGDGVILQVGARYQAIAACTDSVGLCVVPATAPTGPKLAPANGLPDGSVATAPSGDINGAWYARPTGRYAHGVLGDAVEAGSLVVNTADERKLELILPEAQVFEDITPRIADLDGNGSNEVITLRASLSGGGGVVIYGLVDGDLREIAAGSENGRPNRWLNIAGFLPRLDGGLTIYGVRTPHIGGRLFSLDFKDGAVAERNDIALDVSNHVIGSRELDLSAVGEFGGRTELILPSQDRRRLRFPLSDRADIALPGPIDRAIALVDGHIVTATESGDLLVIRP
ncbi:hypothetical protein [Hoeflea sp.]|uniref:hypothetical protein n=1 Tax=Hoeflea sp. TaxID=1940281 RepID=UPI00374A72CC